MKALLATFVVLAFAGFSFSQDASAPAQSSAPGTSSGAPGAPASPSKLRKKRSKKTGARKVVVTNGSTSETGGTLSPGLSDSEAERQRSSTDQLLHASQVNLKEVSTRELTPEQQDRVQQINAYIQQSHSASEDGDLQRAHNLALKARLLSDTLVHP
jgi:hypothetical protein